MRESREAMLMGSNDSGTQPSPSILVLLLFSVVCIAVVAGDSSEAEHWAAPWTAPPSIHFPYEGLHNELRKLVEQQAQQKRVSATFFTTAHEPLLLNHVWSLVKYGKARNYIIAAVDPRALERCLRLRLPCYNATHLKGGASAEEHTFASPMWRRLTHLKPTILADIFRLGVDVHFSDVDVTYLRPVWPSYEQLMNGRGADVSFMNENGVPNSGNFVLRYNSRTLSMLDAWLKPPPGDTFLSDQEWLNDHRGSAFDVCSNLEECQRVKEAGRAAMLLHPPQYGKVSWTGHCPGRRPWPACAPYTLYMHIICNSGLRSKINWMSYYELWHLDSDNFTPLKTPHSFLPCKDELAWQEGAPDLTARVFNKVVYDDIDDEDVKRHPLH